MSIKHVEIDGFMEPVFEIPNGQPSCYVAGPEGFSETTRLWHENTLIPMLIKEGAFPLDPWQLTLAEEIGQVGRLVPGGERNIRRRELNQRVARRNYQALKVADFCVASLDGQEIDSGTAAEIGAYYALHNGSRPIFARRSDFRSSGEEGALVNLQVVYFIEQTGGTIVSNINELRAVVAAFIKPVDFP